MERFSVANFWSQWTTCEESVPSLFNKIILESYCCHPFQSPSLEKVKTSITAPPSVLSLHWKKNWELLLSPILSLMEDISFNFNGVSCPFNRKIWRFGAILQSLVLFHVHLMEIFRPDTLPVHPPLLKVKFS